jgi:regulator of sirC expression with transglutaminase-like and TPR domain
MIQLAMPIEPGNSGGPVLDLFGKVHGIVTMKSAVTENLGFAVAINVLKPLRDKPNPTLMSRWLTIGALDPKEWQPLFGANWRQRAGRITVDGTGEGFGSRSLCLWQHTLPKLPCEIAVTVKLDREDGAAGLIFFADGNERHYGFYPSNGKLRLARFDGPDVFSWKVLAERQNENYRPGDWNILKVRLEKGKLTCFVNDKPAIESQDAVLTSGKVGLAKFRTTAAEFRNFRVANQIPASSYSAETVARVAGLTDRVLASGVPLPEVAQQLAADGEASVTLLRERAKKIETQARQLRELAQKLHQQRVQDELAREFRKKEPEIDLFYAGLLISQLDNEEVDVTSYRKALDRLVQELTASVPKGADATARLATLNRFLFDEHGFHGSRGDYYHRSNSYLNEVLDDREGLPITLSVLYLELAKRLDLDVVGVGLPGHFVVKFTPPKGEPRLIDAYERGREVSRETAAKLVLAQTGRPLEDRHLAGSGKRDIAIRMLRNLLNVSSREQDLDSALRYLDAIVAIHPDAGEEHWMRAVLQFQKGRKAESKADVTWLLEHKPADVNLNEVDELRRILDRGMPD